MGGEDTLTRSWGDSKWFDSGKLQQFLISFNIHSPRNPAVPYTGIHSRNENEAREARAGMVTAALLTAEIGLQCPPAEWTECEVCSHAP